MFCQSCGQKNVDEARFCNFCGERIAAPGTPGGRTDLPPVSSEGPAAAPSFTDSLALSLTALGLRTPARAYGFVVLAAVALMAAGGAFAFFATRGDTPERTDSGHAAPGDAFLIGAPIPEGLEPPPFPDDAAPLEAAAPAPDPRAEATTRVSRSELAKDPLPRHAQEPPSAPSAPSAPTPAPAPSPPATPAPSTPSTPPTPAPSTPSAPTPPPSAPSPTPAETPEKAPEKTEAPTPREEPPAPKDPEAEMELELYGGRVRYAISRYYGGATKACFDAATRNNETLSGTVVVAAVVGADGQVLRASLSRNSTGDQSLAECLTTQVRSFRLPPPPRGEIELKLPFSR